VCKGIVLFGINSLSDIRYTHRYHHSLVVVKKQIRAACAHTSEFRKNSEIGLARKHHCRRPLYAFEAFASYGARKILQSSNIHPTCFCCEQSVDQTGLNHPAVTNQTRFRGRCPTLVLRMLQQRLSQLRDGKQYMPTTFPEISGTSTCVQKASRHLVAGKGFGRSCTHPPTSSNWQRLLQKHIFLLMHTHTEVPENSGKVSARIMHRAVGARRAHKALFHMGDARGLAPNSDPHVCKRFRFLWLGGQLHPGVGGRLLSF